MRQWPKRFQHSLPHLKQSNHTDIPLLMFMNDCFPLSLGMLRSHLHGCASKALVGVGHHLSQRGTAVVESAQLLQALRTFHISIAQEVHMCSGEVTALAWAWLSVVHFPQECMKIYIAEGGNNDIIVHWPRKWARVRGHALPCSPLSTLLKTHLTSPAEMMISPNPMCMTYD